ncbi:papain-like cysteine protease family protein [Paludibacterium purpuratum]|uniref:papain-like cysteine protease family protein n=1 Tax=Paludibacterium purpuratum TaxID=1144873 RepID=UPI00105BFC0F|nr:papain-like cysteine protease family protein [Paludibacterium purpuratum]
MRLRIEPVTRTARRIGPLQLAAVEVAAADGGQLGLNLAPQVRSNWCWSAVTCAIAAFYGDTSWRQDSLAWRILAIDQLRPNCEPPPALMQEEQYNQQASLERTLRYVNCLAGWSSGRPPFRRLMRELDEGRPLAVAIRWHSGQQHYVLVDGYCRTRRTISVADPQCGRATVTFDDFPQHYRHGGEWMETYWTHHPYKAQGRQTGESEDEQLRHCTGTRRRHAESSNEQTVRQQPGQAETLSGDGADRPGRHQER